MYHGFQRQPNLSTIEKTLLNHFNMIGCWDNYSMETYSYGSRTDSGVNALGQLISFTSKEKCVLNNEDLYFDDIVIWGVREEVPAEFKVREWALYRDYLYIDDLNYYSSRLSCLRRVLFKLRGFRFFRFLYKDYPINKYGEWFYKRRILKTMISSENDKIFVFVRGESFPMHFIRRLICFLRSYECDKNFIENMLNWKPCLASSNTLFLLRVKVPYYPLFKIDLKETSKWLLDKVFKKVSSDLYEKFLSFSYFSWLS